MSAPVGTYARPATLRGDTCRCGGAVWSNWFDANLDAVPDTTPGAKYLHVCESCSRVHQ